MTLFKEIKEFVATYLGYKNVDNMGLSTEELENLVKRYNLEIDGTLEDYLLFFGRKGNLPQVNICRDSIIEAYEKLQSCSAHDLKDMTNCLQKRGLINNTYDQVKNIAKEFVPLLYDEIGSLYVLSLRDQLDYNYMYEGGEYLSPMGDISSRIRTGLFFNFFHYDYKKKCFVKDETHKIGWFKYYIKLFQNTQIQTRILSNKITLYRHDVTQKNTFNDGLNGNFMSIREYELSFIEYLIQELDLPKMS